MGLDLTTYVIGIDLGTTSIKALLLSSKGDLIATSGEEYLLDYGPGETCELDPELYWEVASRVIKSLILKARIDPEKVKGVSFSSQGETIIVIDRNGQPLRKAIIWLDNRSIDEAKEIEEKFGNQIIMDKTGQPEVLPIWPATRILWLKKNEPHIFNKVKKFLLVEDYLIYRMTGEFYTEHSLVSSTLYFDIVNKTWWDEMLGFLGITASQLPQISPSGTRVHNLTRDAALATGLTPDVEVVTGSYDHPAGAIGAGNILPGITTLTIGASMAFCVTLDQPVNDLSFRLSCQCHSVPGKYFLLPYVQTAGLLLKWFKDNFCQSETALSEQTNIDVFDLLTELAAKIPPGAEGLTVLPHFMGAGSPYFNQKVKGVFAGMTIGMGKGHFVRSIMEAVSAEIHHNLETLIKKDIVIREIRLLGGGSKSPLWCQIIANMTGLNVSTMSCSENASLGAAILAGVGTGIFRSIDHGCKLSIELKTVYKPDPDEFKLYGEVYGRYLKLYNSLEGYWQ